MTPLRAGRMNILFIFTILSNIPSWDKVCFYLYIILFVHLTMCWPGYVCGNAREIDRDSCIDDHAAKNNEAGNKTKNPIWTKKFRNVRDIQFLPHFTKRYLLQRKSRTLKHRSEIRPFKSPNKMSSNKLHYNYTFIGKLD